MEQLETLGARDHLKPIESKSEICQVLGVVHGGWTMEVSVTPPPLHGPTAKEKKYDRQLRLWAASGQQALEDAHILLLNNGSGVVGIETLKNLVLPGVGTFTIVDEHTVEEEDLGVNFFLSEDSLGKPRGEQCRNYLQELNPEVKLFSVQQSTEDFIAVADLSRYTLILLVSPARLYTVVKIISELAWKLSIPLFYVHSVGFYSHFSVQLPQTFPIVDTHPDPASTQDLRLLAPWVELTEYMKAMTAGMDSMVDHDHGHIPYLLLLLHYLEQWKQEHGGKYPENYKEKSAFRDIVKAGARTNNPEGGEENFDEAVGAVLKSLNTPTIPSGLREIFDEYECKSLKPSSPNFWLIASAIKSFVTTTGALPLPGALPDMKAQSSDYITLQTIYRAKAQIDLAAVTKHIRELEGQLGRVTSIDSKEIEAFCKGAAFVKLVRGQKLRVPYKSGIDWADRANYVTQELSNEQSLMGIYVALVALDTTIDKVQSASSTRNLLAHCDNDSLKADMDVFIKAIFADLRTVEPSLSLDDAEELVQKTAEEIQRTGPVELHNISALAGGVVAQEVIKVITKQYVPVDNTCVIDGIKSSSAVFRL